MKVAVDVFGSLMLVGFFAAMIMCIRLGIPGIKESDNMTDKVLYGVLAAVGVIGIVVGILIYAAGQMFILSFEESIDEQVKNLCDQGKSQREIAQILDIDKWQVYKIMKKHGWRKNQQISNESPTND